jgi:hypothetical protein
VEAVRLAIDGRQPEKGHATLYVVRALERQRVWCAGPLRSSATSAVQPWLVQARVWAERLGKPVRLGMADKQDAFVRGSAAEFPGVPQRSCAHHCLRDVAKPVLAADSRAQGKRRHTVRGLRAIAQEVVAAPRPPVPPRPPEAQGESPRVSEAQAEEGRREGVLDDCTAVRGILHDAQGGPRHPPGLRMAAAWGEGQAALQRHLEGETGGQPTSASRVERAPATGA